MISAIIDTTTGQLKDVFTGVVPDSYLESGWEVVEIDRESYPSEVGHCHCKVENGLIVEMTSEEKTAVDEREI